MNQSIAIKHSANSLPTRGLIIRAEPLQKILSGAKTIELRRKANHQRGVIALIQKGSKHIFGLAEVCESVGPMDFPEFCSRSSEHGVEQRRLQEVFDCGYNVGWQLRKVRRLKSPIAYVHRTGAVTWATLDDRAVEELRTATSFEV